jgi:hypothetical protein
MECHALQEFLQAAKVFLDWIKQSEEDSEEDEDDPGSEEESDA